MSGFIGQLANDVLRRHLMERLYACGPRPIYELLTELDLQHPGVLKDFQAAAERYVSVPASVFRALGADRFPQPPLHEVAQCQR